MKGLAAAAAVPLLGAALVMSLVLMDDPQAAAEPSGGSGQLNLEAVPAAYRDDVVAAGQRCAGVTAPLLAAQIDAESGWNPTATSPAGAQGIAQFMPGTWATWGKDYSGDGRADVMDPTDAIGSQADLMCALYDQAGAALADGTATGDRLQLALAGYNAGFGNVTKYGGIPPFTETQRYVKKILALVATYSLAPSAIDAGGGPAVSDDGTYRVPTDGSGRLDPSTLCQIPWASSGMVLRCDAEKAFEKLNTAYRDRFGTDLVISSAYRDYATQVLLKQQKGDMAATPGRSNHGWGLAVDIGGLGGEGSERHQWLRANAPAYGWQHPSWARSTGSLPEPWHWEFVGTP